MTTLLLIRHGQSLANLQDAFAGHLDTPLQEKGFKQAEKTAEYVVSNYKVDKVYASDLQRAFKTGECVANRAGVEIVPEKNLREIRSDKWDGITFDVLEKKYSEDYKLWINDPGKARCTGGESTVELSERIMKVLTEIAAANDGKTVVIATHATPIRVAQTIIQHGTMDKMKDVPWVSNASVTEIAYENGKFRLVEVSHDEHLGELITVLPDNT